ncbi:MAG: sigma-70 family RNA polymerase sigma factor [Pikeienuella sp.]
MNDNADITDLLRATAKADRAAFRALYLAASAKLFGVALRICGDRSLAEDALQDAFVEIWRKASGFDAERGKAEAWMAVITRNRAIDLVRKRGRGPTFGTGGADEEEWMTALPDPTAPTDGGAEMIALQECLNRLEDQQRDMVLLAYYKGFSREELAARFDAPVNTVKTWLRRGLASLKTCLDE